MESPQKYCRNIVTVNISRDNSKRKSVKKKKKKKKKIFKNLHDDVKNVYAEQKLVAKYNFKEDVFNDNWKHFVKLFD